MTSYLITFSIGLIAQAFFSARILVQWIMSERAGKVLSPTIFWVFSFGGSLLLFLYGWLRDDFSIILGQFIGYYVYLWNLKQKGVVKKLGKILPKILLILPIIAVALVLHDASHFVNNFLKNDNVPLWLLIFGSAGQVTFTLRFVYQWLASSRKEESILPPAFWVISLIGSTIIIIYGIIRLDAILILGQSFGFVAYIRNLFIWFHQTPKANEK